ncbi:hypothetical protein RFI_02363 [Reticulomyxa filosa]|uniref:Uncharacterized protein n=1 Tax=Reticulomyxa filosa TaxID=46433 RepID=X6P9I4_RETFI|nr:hypothetical protein RFI_02363 [Reticulomyxa filosa]|eukprot:ETO34729.1 hypothetical protein RFI_02363 [Reticulomyxa filosa]
MYPGGQLLAFGYLRESQEILNIDIPRDVATMTTEFIGLCLSWTNDTIDQCFKKDGDLNINSQQWMKMSTLDLRVIQDQILYRHSNAYDRFGLVFINEEQIPKSKSRRQQTNQKTIKNTGIPTKIATIVCECQFGMKGTRWLSGIIANANSLTHLTLSNNQLNDKCFEILVDALSQNTSKALLFCKKKNKQKK